MILYRVLTAHGLRFRVNVYPDLDQMRAAGTRFNGNDHTESVAMTQAYEYPDGVLLPVVRFAAGHITEEIVIHEASHVATGLYGANLPDTDDHLTHWNEPLAHLTSRVAVAMLGSLRRAGLI